MQINATITFTIEPATPPLQVGNTTFTGKVGEAITGNLNINGGTPPYNVAVNDPSLLPPGVTVATDGAVSGTPTQDGVFNVGITVSDSTP